MTTAHTLRVRELAPFEVLKYSFCSRVLSYSLLSSDVSPRSLAAGAEPFQYMAVGTHTKGATGLHSG